MPEPVPIPYCRVISVCTNHRDDGTGCWARGEELRSDLKNYVKSRGLEAKVRVSASGCLGLCSEGPNIVVFPEGAWFSRAGETELELIKRRYIDPLLKT